MAEYSKLGSQQAWINWILATMFVVFVFSLQTGYAITNLSLGEDLSISSAQIGVIGSIYTWALAVTQFASGSVMDKLGARWTMPTAAAIVTLGAFLFASATGPIQLIVAQVFMALGGAFGFVGAGFVGGQWFAPIKFGFMFALVQFCASLSAIVGQNIISSFIIDTPWNNIIYTMAFSGAALTVLMFIVMRDPVRDDMKKAPWPGIKTFLNELVESLGEVMAIKDSWINAIIGGATFGCMLSLGVIWGPRFLIASGLEEGSAYTASSMMWLGLAIAAPLFAILSNKLKSRKKPMFWGCFFQLVAIVFILSLPHMSLNEAYFWFFMWGFMGGASVLNFPIGADLVPIRLIGTSAAFCNAVQFIVGGIMMAIPGRVLDGSGLIARVQGAVERSKGIVNIDTFIQTSTIADYRWALLVLPLALTMALFLFFFLNETYPKDVS